ncbi:hypothetical protein QCA50_006533 [Cerrena zonata]|uniref:Uncharacterized protein n=1 Tax=Cerrena zonata TaxID=2478898 RepID=A0AAW0GDU6_9APHY
MYPSLRRSIHKPLIRFIGRRQWPSHPEPQHPHPFAPVELKQSFSDFISKFQSTSSQSHSAASTPSPSVSISKSGANVQVFQEFWQAPERLWRHDLEDHEVELAMTGGASKY